MALRPMTDLSPALSCLWPEPLVEWRTRTPRSTPSFSAFSISASLVPDWAQVTPGDAPAARREDRKAAAQARQRLAEQAKPLKAELKVVEERMAAAQAEASGINERLGLLDVPPSERAELGKRLKALQEAEEALETRWLELTDELDRLA